MNYRQGLLGKGLSCCSTYFPTAAMWNGVLKLSGSIYEVLPGMLAGFLVYAIARLLNFQLVKSKRDFD